MTSTEVEQPKGSVPALVNTPALDIGPQDIALPRVYVGQYMSGAVKDGSVKAGEIYSATGEDDPEPVVLDSPVRIHVLGMRKGLSIDVDGELESYAFGDPDAPKDAYTTYNYVLALPKVDAEKPYKFLLKRTGTATAKRINSALHQHSQQGPPWEIAFDLTFDFRKNKLGDYWVAMTRLVEPDNGDVEIAAALAAFIPADRPESSDSSDADGTDQPGI